MKTAWWARGPKPGNLGDILTPVVLAAFGVRVRWASPTQAQLLAIGSIIRFAKHHDVWGSGAMHESDRPSPRARYLAVRGPLTRECVRKAGGDCPAVYGDPAMLLPLFHNEPVQQIHDIGIVPHYRDRGKIQSMGLPEISPLCADPLKVVDRIRQCRAIISSSLHGIVVAHAYGIPAAWLATHRINGDGIKFRDHAASIGVEMKAYDSVSRANPVVPKAWDPEPLIKALETLR